MLIGLHGRADGRMESADFEVVRVSGVRAVKLVSTAAPEDVDQLRSIQPEMFILVRLFADLRFRRVTADEFADWAIADARPFYARGVRHFEIHNEPNLVAEGWGQSWANGDEFAAWFLRVYGRLKAVYHDIRLGYPGLSPGPNLNGIRLAEEQFMRASEAALRAADWIGAHCYWTSESEILSPAGGLSYRKYLPYGKPVYITEFSNPNPETPKSAKGQQYARYFANLRDTEAAFGFVASASHPGFRHETWREEDGTLSPIPFALRETAPRMKLSAHVMTQSDDAERFLLAARPKYALLVDDYGMAPTLKAAGIEVIGRRSVRAEYDPNKPIYTPQQYFDLFLREHVLANPDITVWKGINEPHPKSLQAWATYAQFSIGLIDILHAHGKRCVVGNPATGVPDGSLSDIRSAWVAYMPAIRHARLRNGFVGVHEYSGDLPLGRWLDEEQTIPNTAWLNPGAPVHELISNPDWRNWFAGRYRFLLDACRNAGEPDPQILIMECGIGDVGPVEPFRESLNGDGRRYAREYMIPYDRLLQADPAVEQAFVFTFGGQNTWPAFRVDGSGFADELLVYQSQLKREKRPMAKLLQNLTLELADGEDALAQALIQHQKDMADDINANNRVLPYGQPRTGSFRVAAFKLNVRQFPWLGTITPPVLRQLDNGATVNVLGAVKSGIDEWGCISPDGNEWVSMRWLA